MYIVLLTSFDSQQKPTGWTWALPHTNNNPLTVCLVGECDHSLIGPNLSRSIQPRQVNNTTLPVLHATDSIPPFEMILLAMLPTKSSLDPISCAETSNTELGRQTVNHLHAKTSPGKLARLVLWVKWLEGGFGVEKMQKTWENDARFLNVSVPTALPAKFGPHVADVGWMGCMRCLSLLCRDGV